MNRLKSFLWRLGAYLIAMGLAWIGDNLGLLELSPFETAAIGLFLGEVSKWWNNKMQSQGLGFLGRVRK